MFIASGTIELGLSIAASLIKLGGRIDRIMAGQTATRSPLTLPVGVRFERPTVIQITRWLQEFLESAPTGLSDSERNTLSQTLASSGLDEITLMPFMEQFLPDKLFFRFSSIDEEMRNFLIVLSEQGIDLGLEPEETAKIVYYLGPGADLRDQSLPWQIGMAVFGTLAEFALQNQQALLRNEETRKIIAKVLERLVAADFFAVASGRALAQHILKATLNGVVDARDIVDGDNPWLESVLQALADARAAQPAQMQDEYILGLIYGRGYKGFIAELVEQGAEIFGSEESESYQRVLAEVLSEASNKIRDLPEGNDFKYFFDNHWADLARAGLRSVAQQGPLLLDGTQPILKEALTGAVSALAESKGRSLFTQEILINATEAAILAVAAKPELFGTGKVNDWMKDFYGAFGKMVRETGIQGVINPVGLQRILLSAIDTLADFPELIIDQPGLPQDIIRNLLKKIGSVNRMDAESLGTAVVDSVLMAIAENPALIISDTGVIESAFAEVAGDFAANIASKVRTRSISKLQGADLITAGTAAIAANPQLFSGLESQLSTLLVDQVLKVTAEDPYKLIAGAALVSLTEAVLSLIATRGVALLDGSNASALAERIGVVIKSVLEMAVKELGRQVDLRTIPMVVSGILYAWAYGELDSVDPEDVVFQKLFTQLAAQHSRFAA